MGTTRIDDKNPVRRPVYPNAKFLLKLGIDSQTEICRVANLERSGRLKQRTWQKETEEGDEPCRHESGERGPRKAPAPLIDIVIFRTHRCQAR